MVATVDVVAGEDNENLPLIFVADVFGVDFRSGGGFSKLCVDALLLACNDGDDLGVFEIVGLMNDLCCCDDSSFIFLALGERISGELCNFIFGFEVSDGACTSGRTTAVDIWGWSKSLFNFNAAALVGLPYD